MSKDQKKTGIIITYAGQVIHILTSLIYTPVMLRILGPSEYGLYQLVYSVVSYLSILNLGFGASYIRFYSREKANNNEDNIANLNSIFMMLFCALGVVCLLAGIVMIVNIQDVFKNGLTQSEYSKARVLMSFMVVNLALTFPNSVYNCIVTAHERFVFQKTIILLQYLMNPLIALPLLLMGYGSIGMVVVTTALTLAALISNIYFCHTKIHARFKFNNLCFGPLKEIGAFTFFIFLNQVIDLVNWSVDKYLLGRLSGTVAVAIYSVGGQINSMYIQFSTAVSNVFIPKVNRIVAEEKGVEELTTLFVKVGRIQYMLLSLIISIFIIFGKPFIRLWAGSGYEQSYYVALLLIIPVTIPLIQNIGIEIQRAMNKHRVRSIVYLFIACANIIISIPLIQLYGPIGAAVGTAASIIIGNILFMNWYYYRRLGINIPLFIKSMLSFIPAILVSVVLGVINLKFIQYRTFYHLTIGVGIYSILYCSVLYITGMNESEKKLIDVSIKGIKRKLIK